MKQYINNPEPTAADVERANAWANRLPDAPPGVEQFPAIHGEPLELDNCDFDDSEWLSSLKDKA